MIKSVHNHKTTDQVINHDSYGLKYNQDYVDQEIKYDIDEINMIKFNQFMLSVA